MNRVSTASRASAGNRPVPSLLYPGPELTVVVPTFNERANVTQLIGQLDTALSDIDWEVLFVDDDSPDGTAGLLREIGREDARVRCVHRIGRRGLSAACIEGMLASGSPYIAVMDADLQHDESLLPKMLLELRSGSLDIVIGSRFLPGGGVGDWESSRVTASRAATKLSRMVIGTQLSDPMSGFFMMTRDAFDRTVGQLSGLGFKILLDIFASSPRSLRYRELPYQFRRRQAGESKLDSQVIWSFMMLLLDKRIGHILPVRFVSFIAVGALGVIVHVAVQALLIELLAMPFAPSQALATIVAMTSNFAVNNALTYRDVRLHGWTWIRGWLSFCLACSVGAVANVGIASYIYGMEVRWIVASVAGILVSAVWNYAVTRRYTWGAS